MTNNSRGRWIIHEVGYQKVLACSNAFYTSCTKRFSKDSGTTLDYLPWMASPVLAKIIISNPSEFDVVTNSSVFCFEENYLQSIARFLNKAIETDAIREFPRLRVFKEIKSVRPSSIVVHEKALSLVENWQPWQKLMFSSLVKSIIPICWLNSSTENGNSFSDHNFIGAIFTSVDPKSPFPDLTLNIAFAHELGHQALMIYQHSGDLFFNTDEWVYSGIRKTLRPAVSAFHAVVALAFMIECAKNLLEKEVIPSRIAYLRARLNQSLTDINLGLKAFIDLPKSELCNWIYRDLNLFSL